MEGQPQRSRAGTILIHGIPTNRQVLAGNLAEPLQVNFLSLHLVQRTPRHVMRIMDSGYVLVMS